MDNNEKLFLELLRRMRPYLYDINMGIDRVKDGRGFGTVTFKVLIRDSRVNVIDTTVTEQRKYVGETPERVDSPVI